MCNALQAVKLLHARRQHTQLSNSGSLKQIQSPRSSSEEQQNKQKGVKGNTPAREANTNVQRTYKELHFKKKKLHTADAVSLLSERALSKSLKLSSLVLFFFPLGTGSFSFFCFLLRFNIPISHRGHNT